MASRRVEKRSKTSPRRIPKWLPGGSKMIEETASRTTPKARRNDPQKLLEFLRSFSEPPGRSNEDFRKSLSVPMTIATQLRRSFAWRVRRTRSDRHAERTSDKQIRITGCNIFLPWTYRVSYGSGSNATAYKQVANRQTIPTTALK